MFKFAISPSSFCFTSKRRERQENVDNLQIVVKSHDMANVVISQNFFVLCAQNMYDGHLKPIQIPRPKAKTIIYFPSFFWAEKILNTFLFEHSMMLMNG